MNPFYAFKHLWIVFLLATGVSQVEVHAQKLPWKKQKIAKGIRWHSLTTNHLFESKQSVNLLEIKGNRHLSIAHSRKRKTTSAFGQESQALAALNGGFFNMEKGGSVTYLKANDSLISPHRTSSLAITRHCLAINEKGNVSILSSPDTTWLSQPENYDDVLFTGPLLMQAGEIIDNPSNKFNDTRHPRTCLCTRKGGKTVWVTVDGRNEEAVGMSIPELSLLMKELGCQDAINLDGGGSTSMWIAGKGIVNHPSDNKKFDSGGERAVANVLLLK